jgi:predicted nucleic-acid-binding protein
MADDEDQLAAVDRLVSQAKRTGEQLFIPLFVLCEVVWVLESNYSQKKAAIITALENILLTDLFVIEQSDIARLCMDLYRQGKADFSDYIIAETCHRNGCKDMATFDRTLKGARGVSLLSQ